MSYIIRISCDPAVVKTSHSNCMDWREQSTSIMPFASDNESISTCRNVIAEWSAPPSNVIIAIFTSCQIISLHAIEALKMENWQTTNEMESISGLCHSSMWVALRVLTRFFYMYRCFPYFIRFISFSFSLSLSVSLSWFRFGDRHCSYSSIHGTDKSSNTDKN